MPYSYEAVVPVAGRDYFLAAFIRYMKERSFAHTRAGGRVGDTVSHQFRREDDVVTLAAGRKGQGQFQMVVQSATLPVEPLVLDVVTEGVADFLEPFSETLSERAGAETLTSLVKDLRGSFASLLDKQG